MLDLPYAKQNLRYNPFGELDRQDRIDLAIPRCDFDEVTRFVLMDKSAVQFIGEMGSGKSTHLLLLASQLPQFGYLHLPVDQSRIVLPKEFLLVDEAQRIPRLQVKSLFQQANHILLGTHRCFEKRLLRLGFQVKTINLDLLPNDQWLQSAFQRRIDRARRSDRTVPQIQLSTVLKLRNKFGNNIRAMERQLYEQFLELEGNDEQV